MQDITIELSNRFYEIYKKVHKNAIISKHRFITPAHILLEMIDNLFCIGYLIIFELGAPIDELKLELEKMIAEVPTQESGNPVLSDGLAKVLDTSLLTAKSMGKTKIDSGYFLIGILRNIEIKEYSLLRRSGVSYSDVLNKLANNDIGNKPIGDNDQQIIPEIEEEKLKLKDVLKIISPIFYVLLASAVGLGYGLYKGFVESPIFVFLFVIISWIISVSVHEYGHAITAYFLGDLSIRNKGYLSLNPLKYTNIVTSIVLPILILAMGGIGLPGGAVYIDFSSIKSRRARSIVSAAGPIMQTFFILFMLAIYYVVGSSGLNETNRLFWTAYSFLLFLQITSIFFNLLPIPPLDGFGIIMPFLPEKVLRVVNTIRGFTMWIIFAIFRTNNPIQQFFWKLISLTLYILGIDGNLVFEGFDIFQIWD